jgi:hypothetical protein
LAISTPIRAAIPVCCTCSVPNSEFFARKQGISEFAVCPASFIVSRSSCITRMVSRFSGRVSPNPVHRAVTDGDSVSTAACPRERGRRKEHNATALVRRGSASCSGFSLLLIEAYSYIVNPRSRYGQAALPRIAAPRCRKAPPVLFHLHAIFAPRRLRQISALHSHDGSAYKGAPAVQETVRRRGRRV